MYLNICPYNVLPQGGTIAYQQLLESGGITGALAPQIAKIAGILNPEGQAAADSFNLGKDVDG